MAVWCMTGYRCGILERSSASLVQRGLGDILESPGTFILLTALRFPDLQEPRHEAI